MANSFNLKVVTPTGLTITKEVELLKIRTLNGDIAILAGHANYMTQVGTGEMLLRCSDKSEELYYISDGFLEVSEGKATIIAEDAIESANIDVVRLEKEIELKKAILEKSKESKDIVGATEDIKKNLIKIRIGSK